MAARMPPRHARMRAPRRAAHFILRLELFPQRTVVTQETVGLLALFAHLTKRIAPDFQFDSDVPTFQRPSASLFIGVQALSGHQGGQHPMGEKENKPFQLTFNGFLKVDFQGSRVTSDGGLLLVRELDERLGLGKLIDEHLTDSRQGTNKKFPLADLLRQSVYSRLAGYEDLNDAVRVSADPTFRLIGSKKNWMLPRSDLPAQVKLQDRTELQVTVPSAPAIGKPNPVSRYPPTLCTLTSCLKPRKALYLRL